MDLPTVHMVIKGGMVYESFFDQKKVKVFIKDKDVVEQGGAQCFWEESPDGGPKK